MAELEKHVSVTSIKAIIDPLKKVEKVNLIKKDKEDLEKANKLFNKIKVHKSDILHAILANKAGAVYLVTRNIEHFKKIDLVQPILPENL